MDKINSFLDKYQNIKLKDFDLKEFFSKLVKEKTGLEIKPKDIRVNNYQLKIISKSLYKNEIILNKRFFLKHLERFKIKDLI